MLDTEDLLFRIRRKAKLMLKNGALNKTLREIQAKFDRTEFDQRFLTHLDGTSPSRKFVLIDKWLRDAITRYYAYDFDKLPREATVCDLGCGAGYFLLVCEHFGHRTIGLDLDDDPLYDELIDFFSLKRVIHRIEPFQPLAGLGDTRFDAFTAYMTCFNRYSDGRPWMGKEWAFFLDDLRQRLSHQGRVAIKFNRNHDSNVLYPREVAETIEGLHGYQSRFFGDSLLLKVI